MAKTISKNEFLQTLKEITNDEYELIGEYINTKIKIILKHQICGYEWSVRPSAFVHQNQRCPKCSGMLKKTTEDFKKEVFELTNNTYEVLGDYINAKTKILIKHLKCDTEYFVKPHDFLRGTRCICCNGGSKNKTHDMYLKNISYRADINDYELLSEYTRSDTKILFKHIICNNEFYMMPTAFKSGTKCPYCYRSFKKTSEEFKKDVYDEVGDEYLVVGDYINFHTPIMIKHIKCGFNWDVMPSNFFKNPNKCPNCYGKMYYDTEKFKFKVNHIVGDEYIVIGEYIHSNTKIEIKHVECGKSWNVLPNSFLSGARCPYCKSSSGEKRVKKYLIENNINFKQYYTFVDCKNIGRLIFDFAILDNNDIPYKMIEYDGKQHFEPVEWFGGEIAFNKQIHRDNIKDKYCLEKNIDLLRIPYWEFNNIEDILKGEFTF